MAATCIGRPTAALPHQRTLAAGRFGRRTVLLAGGLLLAGRLPRAAGRTVEVRMVSDTLGTRVGFDPIGLHVAPGTTVRWVVEANVHTSSAYHPANGRHSLRIPSGAQPWDSGYLVNPGEHFDVTLTVEGVYDYFCLPHEAAGMVGRIVVGQPTPPEALPFDYYRGRPAAQDWVPVPPDAQAAFPAVEDILRQSVVRLGQGHATKH
jgi:plastocyanin